MKETTRFQVRLALWGVLIPLVYLAPFSPARHDPRTLPAAMISFVVALGAVALARAGARPEEEAARSRAAARFGLAGAALVYATVSFMVARRGFLEFSPYFSQAGLFAQSLWTTLHGLVLANTHETVDGSLGSHFGVHFSPTLFLLVPLYALWPSPLTLLAVQAVAVALAPVPLYLLLRPRLGAWGGLTAALGLLFLPAFFRAGSWDFHDMALLPVLVLTVLWGLETRRRGVVVTAAVLALGVREDMGLTLIAVGLYAGLRGLGWRTAAWVAALGAAWFVVSVQLVMPRFWSPGLWMDPGKFFAAHLGNWGPDPPAALRAIASDPTGFLREILSRDRLYYVYLLFLPTLFLPILASWAWVGAVPALAAIMLSRHGWMRHALKYHALLPVLFAYVSVTMGAQRFLGVGNKPLRRARGLAAGVVIVAGIVPALVVTGGVQPKESPPPGAARAAVSVVPGEAAVYSDITLYPHLANRRIAACWESLGETIFRPAMRGRYDWFVLWLAGDPAGEARDGILADLLAQDPRFERLEGFAPFVVFKRRSARLPLPRAGS